MICGASMPQLGRTAIVSSAAAAPIWALFIGEPENVKILAPRQGVHMASLGDANTSYIRESAD